MTSTKGGTGQAGVRRSGGGTRHAGLAVHGAVALLASLLVLLFWASRPQWSAEMRLWRAVGDAAWVLLVLTLGVGPLSRLWPRAAPLVRWRRQAGIWFALTALVHAYLVWDGWARWSVTRLLGFEDLSAAGVEDLVLTDPGFGLANLLGLTALFWSLVLLATSSDRAMGALGGRAWKFLHRAAYLILYLVVLHSGYYLFLHYNLSLTNLVFQKGVPDPNWFRFPFLASALLVVGLQVGAFVQDVRKRRAG